MNRYLLGALTSIEIGWILPFGDKLSKNKFGSRREPNGVPTWDTYPQ